MQPQTNPLIQLSVSLKPNLCYFAIVQSDSEPKSFGILQADRRKHVYVLGKTGMGKTTLLQNMVLQDIYNGFGVCFIDPHGDSSEYILDRIPSHRQNDVVYFNPADTQYPIGLNMLEAQHREEPFLIASSLISVFHRIWQGMWSARMEYILNNTLLALLEIPETTLLSVVQMLTDNNYRQNVIRQIQDPLVKNFWQKEFNNFNERYKQEAISPILNKIGQFLSNDLIRNIVGQTHSTLDFRELMDTRKILIVNLSKGRLGEDNSNLLGSLIVTRLQLAALSRADQPEEMRQDFYLYVDEFQNFTTESFTTILSEARKYRLNLILAHQYINQLTESGNDRIKHAIFGNVGTIVTFRLGADDAETIAKEFAPILTTQDFLNLDRTEIALSLSINDKKSKPFLAKTLSSIFDKLNGRMQYNIDISRQLYGVHRDKVTSQIKHSLGYGEHQEQPPNKLDTLKSRSFNSPPNNIPISSEKNNPRLSPSPQESLESLKIAKMSLSQRINKPNNSVYPNSDVQIDDQNLFNLP